MKHIRFLAILFPQGHYIWQNFLSKDFGSTAVKQDKKINQDTFFNVQCPSYFNILL